MCVHVISLVLPYLSNRLHQLSTLTIALFAVEIGRGAQPGYLWRLAMSVYSTHAIDLLYNSEKIKKRKWPANRISRSLMATFFRIKGADFLKVSFTINCYLLVSRIKVSASYLHRLKQWFKILQTLNNISKFLVLYRRQPRWRVPFCLYHCIYFHANMMKNIVYKRGRYKNYNHPASLRGFGLLIYTRSYFTAHLYLYTALIGQMKSFRFDISVLLSN